MKSKSFTEAKRLVCRGEERARACKLARAREERRAARVLLRTGADEIPPVIKAKHRTGAAAWVIA
jgi:hypothetical protein